MASYISKLLHTHSVGRRLLPSLPGSTLLVAGKECPLAIRQLSVLLGIDDVGVCQCQFLKSATTKFKSHIV